MAREPIPTWYFAIVIVRQGARFLAVHEASHGQRWYMPAGRVEPGESIEDAARRETREEAGIPIVLEGILKIAHTPAPDGTARCRVFYVARPADDTPPKSVPDRESLEARWVTVEELDSLELRGAEIRTLFRTVRDGAPIYPLSLVGPE